jgi:prepilin-type N-terminal cleavage/methylation domain-containing protein
VIEPRPCRPHNSWAVRRSLRRSRTASSRPATDEGFTLIELLIVILILPIIVGALAVGLIAVFSIQGSVSARVSDSGDAQVVSSDFESDVQSAQQITTDSTASQCGTGTQLLGLESNPNSAGVYETVISYSEVQVGSTYTLVRNDCFSGAASTATIKTTVSFNVESGLSAPAISPSTVNAQAQLGWISAQPVTNVQLDVTEPEPKGTSYTYDLSAIPEMSSVASTAGDPLVSDTDTTCGFAPTQGGSQFNGTYATTLCFVDFSSYNASEADYPSSCQTFVAYIPGGDTLKFCMGEEGNQPMVATTLPTYPEAFLGNTLLNGDNQSVPFYTALGCPDSTSAETGSGGPTPSCIEPAMYQTDSGYGPTNTLYFTGISVTTPTGAPATGWEFVSADAETTDSNEYISWYSPTAVLTDLPDTVCAASAPQTASNCGTAWWGDTCDNTPNWDGPQGFGTSTVTCQSGSYETSDTKTGTPIVEALTPTSMNITMKGAGLEGIAVGLKLS